jgi:F-type H+-transporting ATPase subunit a
MLGEEGERYADYIFTVLMYLAFSNMIGLLGFIPPTMDINVTAALSLMSIILVEAAGIHKKGTIGWLKSFAQPMAVVAPMNIMELAIRPLSLCMRLFGNIIGATVIMELIKHILPVALPVPFCLYFDIFDGLIQAYVFVFLTSLYIKEAIE